MVKPVHAQPDPVFDAEAEAMLRAEVERAVAPYIGVAPPAVLAVMREGAERYYREHPQASRILQLLSQQGRVRSGTDTREAPADQGRDPATRPHDKRRR